MTVGIIIVNYLKENSYDGLCNPSLECGCGLEYGLAPCDGLIIDCEPAYKHRCVDEIKKKYYLEGECPLDCGGECFKRINMEPK